MSRSLSTERRSQLARQILDNPLWDVAFDEMKESLFQSFIENTDMVTRERIAMAVDMIDDLKMQIEASFQEGVNLTIVGDDNG